MHSTKFKYAILFLIVISAVTGRAQDKKAFPTEEEITLLITQTNRAVEQYKLAVDREELKFGKIYAQAVARDREVSTALDVALKTFGARPQGFNSAAGFSLVLWLDNADRNMLLCASGALSGSMTSLMTGDTRKAEDLMSFSQFCSDTSTLLYTVGESAAALYQKYLEGEQQLAQEASDAVLKCADILKKRGAVPKN